MKCHVGVDAGTGLVQIQPKPLGNQFPADVNLHALVNRIKGQTAVPPRQAVQIQLIFPYCPNGCIRTRNLPQLCQGRNHSRHFSGWEPGYVGAHQQPAQKHNQGNNQGVCKITCPVSFLHSPSPLSFFIIAHRGSISSILPVAESFADINRKTLDFYALLRYYIRRRWF